jgi:hypothetical protein
MQPNNAVHQNGATPVGASRKPGAVQTYSWLQVANELTSMCPDTHGRSFSGTGVDRSYFSYETAGQAPRSVREAPASFRVAQASGHVASAFDHSDIRGSEPHILVGPEPASH